MAATEWDRRGQVARHGGRPSDDLDPLIRGLSVEVFVIRSPPLALVATMSSGADQGITLVWGEWGKSVFSPSRFDGP